LDNNDHEEQSFISESISSIVLFLFVQSKTQHFKCYLSKAIVTKMTHTGAVLQGFLRWLEIVVMLSDGAEECSDILCI